MVPNDYFAKFLTDNNLSNKEVADYLGKSPQAVSLILHGKCKLSPQMLEKLLESNWDTSMLPSAKELLEGYERRGRKPTFPGTSITAKASGGGTANAVIGSHNTIKNTGTESSDVAVLRKEVEMLRAQLKDKEELISFLKSLLLTK